MLEMQAKMAKNTAGITWKQYMYESIQKNNARIALQQLFKQIKEDDKYVKNIENKLLIL